jgi:hypothetical protein
MPSTPVPEETLEEVPDVLEEPAVEDAVEDAAEADGGSDAVEPDVPDGTQEAGGEVYLEGGCACSLAA